MKDERLSKERRIRKKEEILSVLRRGKKIENGYLRIYYMEREKDSRIAISVKRKIVNSVKRNKIRRRLKEIFRKERKEYKKNIDMVVIVKEDISRKEFIKTKENFNNLLKRREIL